MSAGRTPVDDEIVGIDVSRYARHLLRRWYVVAAITLAGGAIGWGVARLQAPLFVGTARLTIMQAGSGPAADAVVAYQAALQDDGVLTAAIARLHSYPNASGLTIPQLRQALSWRMGFPPNSFIVEARHSDADLASRIADVMARQALESTRASLGQQLAKKRTALQEEAEVVDLALAKARAELDAFEAANPGAEKPIPIDEVIRAQAERHELSSEIPAEQARLTALEADVANFSKLSGSGRPEAPKDYYSDLLRRTSESRARLASLQAKRAEFDRILKVHDSDAAQRYGALLRNLVHAEITKDLLVNRTFNEMQFVVRVIDVLALVEAPHTPGRAITNRAVGVPRGLAAGFVLAVFGVLFYRRIW